MIHRDLNLLYYTLNTIHHHDQTKTHYLSYLQKTETKSSLIVSFVLLLITISVLSLLECFSYFSLLTFNYIKVI